MLIAHLLSPWRTLTRAALVPCLVLAASAACYDSPVAPQSRNAIAGAALDVDAAITDLEVVRTRLLQLSASGAITTDQLRALLEQLEGCVRQRKSDGNRPVVDYFAPLLADLQALIASGVLTPEQAQPLIDAIRVLGGTWVDRRAIAAGYRFTCALTEKGKAQCWGINDLGQLGDGTTHVRINPVHVLQSPTFRQLTAGSDHVCGLTADGAAYCWGGNAWGQLGDSTTIDRHAPTPVATARRFRSISAGGYHTCAITRAGHVWCWGRNDVGMAGTGSFTSPRVPTPIADERVYTDVRGAAFHSCGIVAGAGAHCWGWNAYAQLGDGTLTSRRVPTPVTGATNFVEVAPYGVHSCALDAHGAAYCWGENGGGSLGDGTMTRRLVPVAVAGGWTFARLSNGGDLGSFTCGVATSGETLCWGINNYGQIGDGTNTTRPLPTPIAGATTFVALTGGGEHNCGQTANDAIYCWGGNFTGQLGDGTFFTRLTPTRVQLIH